ncbi:hypothetical protein BD408DRAFT_415591 [Parasitella parasitica]|nr:hypothetical protein BD408DRAFT_415591 [Parasitella parasitica]
MVVLNTNVDSISRSRSRNIGSSSSISGGISGGISGDRGINSSSSITAEIKTGLSIKAQAKTGTAAGLVSLFILVSLLLSSARFTLHGLGIKDHLVGVHHIFATEGSSADGNSSNSSNSNE